MKQKVVLALFALTVVGVASFWLRPEEPISSITWETIDGIYNPMSISAAQGPGGKTYQYNGQTCPIYEEKTFERLRAEWKRFQGKRVQWTGVLADATRQDFGSLSLQFQMPGQRDSCILFELKDSERWKMEGHQKGDSVTFIGTLGDWGTGHTPFPLTHGEIVQWHERAE